MALTLAPAPKQEAVQPPVGQLSPWSLGPAQFATFMREAQSLKLIREVHTLSVHHASRRLDLNTNPVKGNLVNEKMDFSFCDQERGIRRNGGHLTNVERHGWMSVAVRRSCGSWWLQPIANVMIRSAVWASLVGHDDLRD
ncbi:hypothetical protein MGYG_00095 [Nannizzia gypsea CBS 118893]|uniref:Uncharacterized protein n=1 Tax=Arthroderma gypseum (strain ATCC MYA-4604 / CBS 118893) TaxID=535722 RepID=E5R2R7_ARTGP|nr:hypothetical protein MGYG_00095 [Nannizzia gypsea CBS 118893]EFQ97051.1 hypothetical protein MGYG_00095 [Nannizzia gypsea CBS 118893]